jgi:hypothetical protein
MQQHHKGYKESFDFNGGKNTLVLTEMGPGAGWLTQSGRPRICRRKIPGHKFSPIVYVSNQCSNVSCKCSNQSIHPQPWMASLIL